MLNLSLSPGEEVKPNFTGHDTFALRYGWLKKVYDKVVTTKDSEENKNIFTDDRAIVRFGVGKNMVLAMRHWAKFAGIIEVEANSLIKATPIGHKIFGKDGRDPYMEYPTTLWLIHWLLSSSIEAKTTWFLAFNCSSREIFERDHLIKALIKIVDKNRWKNVSPTTIKNDVGCFLNTYAAQKSIKNIGYDDMLECPLIELGLIKSGSYGQFHFIRGSKPTLGRGVFAYALVDFWNRHSPFAPTLSFESIVYAVGSPGRVFLLDEREVEKYLEDIADTTGGYLQWSEATGLRQVVRDKAQSPEDALSYINIDFASHNESRAA